MSNLTTTLTVLLSACKVVPAKFEYRIYEVMSHMFELSGFSNERKADLYAILVESVTPKDTFEQMEVKVEDALAKNTERFYG